MEKKPEQKFSMTTEAKFCLWESVRKKRFDTVKYVLWQPN